jgi:hypothetical protein
MSDIDLTSLAGKFGPLSRAESRMLHAAATEGIAFGGGSEDPSDPSNDPRFSQTGDPAKVVSPWGSDRDIRAELIRWLFVNEAAKKLLDPSGIRVLGARVVGDLNLASVNVPVPISLNRCRILRPASFHSSQLESLDMEGCWTKDLDIASATVRDSLALSGGFHADGQVDLSRTRIAHDLNLSGAFVMNPSGYAIRGDGFSVGGYVFLIPGLTSGFHADGTVLLTGATIGGDLDCTGAEFHSPGRGALLLQRAVIGGALSLKSSPDYRFRAEGTVDLRNTRCKLFTDDKGNWPPPGHLRLDGFTYDSVSGDGWDAETRKGWLNRDATLTTQPYRQLAKVFRESGQEEQRQQVLIAMEARLSASMDGLASHLFRAYIGYGYKTSRADIAGLAALSGLGALLYWRSYRMGKMVPTDEEAARAFKSGGLLPDHYPHFQPVVFSIENTFPLVKLGQVDKWQPAQPPHGPVIRWVVWAQVLLGWLFATLFVADVAGLVKHD